MITSGTYPVPTSTHRAASLPSSVRSRASRGNWARFPGDELCVRASGGQSMDYSWSGALEKITTAAAASAGTPAAATVFTGATGGSTTPPSGVSSLDEYCPRTLVDTCNIIYESNGSDIVEVTSSGSTDVSTIDDPSGATYDLAYTSNNLTSLSVPSPTGSGTSTWNY